MFKSKTHGKVNLKQKITKTILVTMTGVFFGLSLGIVSPGKVQSAPSSYLNFQARLLTNSGAIVPDGNYHVEFKLYDVSSGGSALWTETRTTGNLVSVKSGYLSVYLGQVSAFPGTINWGEEHWLTMNIGGAGGAASWDGEMTPRLRLTAVPHAFRANSAGNVNSLGTNSASTNSSNVSITTGNAAGATSNSGSITIDSGTATGTTGSISLGASNASALTIGRSGITTTLQGSVALTGSGTALTVTNDASIGGDLTVTGAVTATDGLTVGTGSNFVNQGSTLFTAVAVSDVAGGGNIGTAAATVDIATTFNINQTTASQTLTLPNPTTATAGRIAFVNNVGSASFTMYGSVIGTGKSNTFIWNGSSWVTTVSLSGSVVDTVGSVDSQTKSANGAVITGNAIYLQTADIDDIGLVSIAAQTFNGIKTFDDGLVVTTGGATIAAGDLAVNSGSITSSSATLTVNAGGTVDIQDNLTADAVTADTGNVAITSGDLTTAGTSRLTNGGALQNITGYTQTSGAFALSGAGNFSVDSSAFDVSTAGAVSGVTTLTASGNINTTAGAFQLNGTDINTAGTLTNVAYENQANVFTQANTFQGNLTIENTGYLATQRAADYSTTGTSDDANLGAASLVRLTGASTQTLTGIAGGADGRILTIVNAAAQAATLSNEGGTSAAANRIVTGTGGDIALPAGATITLVYDAGASRWRVSGTVAATGGSGVNTIGAVDSQIKSANGAVISGTNLYLQTADIDDIGLVSIAAQTFNGVKTFDDGLVVTDGGATITAGGLTVTAGLTTLNGGLTVEAGDTFTFNGDAITDLTGSGLTLNTGALTVDNTVLDDTFFMQGGNSFGATAVLGTNDANSLAFETSGSSRMIIGASGNISFDTDVLYVDATNNRVGIGDATPDFKFDVEGTSTAGGVGAAETLASIAFTDTGNVTSGTDTTIGLNVSMTRTGASAGNINTAAIQGTGVGDTGGTSVISGLSGAAYNADTSYGVNGLAYMVGSTAISEVAGVSGTATTLFGSGLAVTNAFGLQGSVGIDNGTATVTNAAGLNIKSATNSAGGTITNNYGVRILNQTVGTNDYGVYVQGADTYALWIDSGATRLDGTLEVQSTSTFTGLATFNGGLTVEAGDTFTFNSDAFTDLTGTGLTLSGGALTVDTATLDDSFFVQNGNSFGAAAVLGTNDSYSLQLETAGTTRLTLDTSGNATLTGNMVVQGTGASSVAGTLAVSGVTTIGSGLTSGVAMTVNNGTSTGNILNLQDNGTNVFTVADGGNVGIKTGSNAPTADLTFGDGANRTINVLTRTSAGAGNNLTVVAGAANGSNNAGGVLTLQGGNAGTGNAHGGNVVLTGGTGVGTGTTGLVVIGTPTYQTASVQNFTGSASITQANIDGNGAILISSNAAGYTATLSDPTITTAGRVVYVTNIGLYDMTLSVNGGGAGNTVTLKPNTTATMIWNGSDWTAAGASSSTDLQAAYNNTATSAGGAELVLNASGGAADGLTIRNNTTTPIEGGILEVQSSIGTNLFSVNNRGSELADNGGSETSSTFSTNWTAAPAGGTVSRTTTAGQYVTGLAGAQVATTGTNHGIRNNLSANPVVSTTYTVSFTAKASVAITGDNLNVQYSRDGGTDLEACTAYSTQNLSTSVWTKITCTITTDGTTATNPDLIIRQGDATSRNIWIDNLSFIRNDSTTQPSNVQIGGGNDGGPITLFTLDRATAPPVAAGDSTYYGSMYYDTTTGSIQCYEADGWGACGSPPDNIITLTPEYTGAVLNGSGVGTMTADFCGNGGGLSVNTTFCASGEARNYYRWTSPQASDQTYSIFVTYKLPTTFKSFLDDNTITLTAYKDHATNAEASLEVFRKNVSGGSISQCGSTTTITTGTSTWNTTSLGGSGETTCGFTGGDYVIFKINMMAKSNANVYVENLDFTFNNR